MIDIFTKYASVKPVKDKNFKTVLHGFIERVNECKQKPNELWVDEGREFYMIIKFQCTRVIMKVSQWLLKGL